jgi:hypothetical protein
MSISISGQTRTPPALKWMLNERAAVAGRLSKAATRLQSLNSTVVDLQRRLETAQAKASAEVTNMAGHQGTLDALDASMSMMYQQARPDAGGTVNAWAGDYGKRGGLEAFVLGKIKNAAPTSVSSCDIRLEVAAYFNISATNFYDKRCLRRSVIGVLTRLGRKGLIEPSCARTKANAPGFWRLKQPTTLADLAAKAAAMRGATVDEGFRRSSDSSDSSR